MKAIKRISVYALIVLGFGATGCKKYLDVNKDPNIARDATPALLLSSGQMNVAAALGVDMNINGGLWAQYWTQAPNASQYKAYEQYLPTASEYDREWGILYNGALADFKKMEQIAAGESQNQYIAVSKLMQAYTYQLITDAWGDIPFSEAVKGAEDDGEILAPKYDRQEAVYDGIIKMTQDAIALIDPADPIHPGTDDLVYGGDMSLWLKFANTLLLKMYLRLSEINDAKMRSGIAALGAGPFIMEGETAEIKFISTAGNQNPLYSEAVGLNFTQNLVASATSTDSMIANNDDRRFSVYTPAGADVVGLDQGNFNAPAGTVVSFPSAITGAESRNTESATAPIKLISSYESLFLQAEAQARTGSSTTAKELFEKGVTESFVANGAAIESFTIIDSPTIVIYTPELAANIYMHGDTIVGFLNRVPVNDTFPSSYWGVYRTLPDVSAQVRSIITQKWFAMNGTQGFEAWTEWRRTDHPKFFVYSATTIIGNVFPGSFLYPNVELTRNSNFPGQKQVTTKVWWDNN